MNRRAELRITERAVLLVLLAGGGQADADDMTGLDGWDQAAAHLEAEDLIDVVRLSARRFGAELTEEGWGWCVAELAAGPPPGLDQLDPDEQASARALYAVLDLLRCYLDAKDMALADFVTTANASHHRP